MNVVPLHAAPIRPARPPLPALLATLLAAGYAVNAAYTATTGLLDHDLLAIVPIFELVVWGLLLAGLWRGSNLAYTLVTIAAIFTVVAAAADLGDRHDALAPALRLAFGVALLLLLVPRSSRTFYARRR